MLDILMDNICICKTKKHAFLYQCWYFGIYIDIFSDINTDILVFRMILWYICVDVLVFILTF
jgi:hypothetical protein